jgi:hypothetical protein
VLGVLAKTSDQHVVCISDEVVEQPILQAVQGEQLENGGDASAERYSGDE